MAREHALVGVILLEHTEHDPVVVGRSLLGSDMPRDPTFSIEA